MKRILTVILISTMAVVMMMPAQLSFAAASTRAGEASYIKSLAVTDGDMAGAISESKSDDTIIPYFADFACLGLTAYGRSSDQQTVLNYINWHIGHMNDAATDKFGISGTIYDYIAGVSTGSYDSTDSYAATFLTLLYKYSETYDPAFLKDRESLIDTLTNVMLATYIDKIGLTSATPDYDECILMDNCEVYQGFVSAFRIYEKYCGNSAKSATMAQYAATVKKSIIRRYWSSTKGCFYADVDLNGKADSAFKLNRFYLDASSQLYPVIYGVISPKSKMAKSAYSKFKKYYLRKGVAGRDWAACSVKGSEGYPWCILLGGVIKMGDKATAARFKKNVKAKFISKGHKYPYYCGEAGQLLLTLSN